MTAMGHKIIMRGDCSSSLIGSAQVVMRDFTKRMNFGASDPRKDGAAISELRRPTAQRQAAR